MTKELASEFNKKCSFLNQTTLHSYSVYLRRIKYKTIQEIRIEGEDTLIMYFKNVLSETKRRSVPTCKSVLRRLLTLAGREELKKKV